MLVALLSLFALADEGMWLPEQLPELAAELSAAGISLSSDALADPLGEPLGAVVSLGGCTASFVSSDGLMLTNHHCAEGILQVNSDAEHNYARDGYLAATRSDELSAGPARRVTIVQSIEDVTSMVLGNVRRRGPDTERHQAIERARLAIEAGCESAAPDLRCRVAAYHGGLQYKLVTAREIRDIRLVYAPPASVGSYGGEIDNWMWPRHAGDFAVLRAYVGPDGASATYSEDNVPFAPAHHLQVAPGGVKDGDGVLVAGFPGSTDRHAPLWQLEHTVLERYPTEIADRQKLVDALQVLADSDPQAAAKLPAVIGSLGNGLKYRQGIVDGFESSGALELKRVADAELAAWIAADPKRKRTYGAAIDELRELDAEAQATWYRDAIAGALPSYVDLLGVAHGAYRTAVERGKPDAERDAGYQERDLDDRAARFAQLDDTLFLPGDRVMAEQLFGLLDGLPDGQRVAPFDTWVAAQGGTAAALDALFAAEALTAGEARAALLEADVASFASSTDPWVQLAVALEDGWYAPRRERQEAVKGARQRLMPIYMEGLLSLHDGKVYPDANSTLRVTYGRVTGMQPRDGVWYLPFTTTAGMAAKAGPSPFNAPPFLLDAVPTASQSAYAAPELGDVPVDFLSTVDTTGGNSGSPTLDGEGRLVGLLFDGTYESIIADEVFVLDITRSIHVDIRYVLWVLEQAGASAVLDELLAR